MKITQVRLNAAAKINLTLDITGLRQDGYHTLESVMQTVSLYDTVILKANDTKKIQLSLSGAPFIPNDSRNTCYKAAQLYFEACGREVPGVEIRVIKTIPSSAGLGGGSADAAAVLRGLEYIYGKCPVDIFEIAAKIGADVPFCLAGGTRLCRGIGEIMTPININNALRRTLHLVIAKNARGLSTPFMFSQYDNAAVPAEKPNVNRLLSALQEGNVREIANSVCNVFQPIAIAERPEIAELIGRIKGFGALNAVMTGSGTAVYGIFEGFQAARRCVHALKKDGIFAEYARFITPHGV